MAASPWSKREDADAFLQAYACDNTSGDSILHLAVRKNDFELAEQLLTSNFPVTIHNDDGKTPLHLAAELGSVDAGIVLVGSGADVLARQQISGHDGATSGSHAGSDPESVRFGDDIPPSKKDRILEFLEEPDSPHALQIAIDRADQDMAEMLIKDGLPTKMDSREEYAVMRLMAKAFIENQERVLKAFRKKGWSVHRKHSRSGRPFLHYVCEEAEDVDPIERLVASGASVKEKDLGRATVLHIAGQRGRCSDGSVIRYLVDNGAQIDTTDIVFNGTPLVAAI